MIINIKQKERVINSLDSMYDTFCDLEDETTDVAKQCVYKQHYSNLSYIKLYVKELHGEIDRLNELLKEQPKIVRCKECKRRTESGFCREHWHPVSDEQFCEKGTSKDGEQ